MNIRIENAGFQTENMVSREAIRTLGVGAWMNNAVHVKVKIVKLNLVRIGARPVNVDLASIDNTSLQESVILKKMEKN